MQVPSKEVELVMPKYFPSGHFTQLSELFPLIHSLQVESHSLHCFDVTKSPTNVDRFVTSIYSPDSHELTQVDPFDERMYPDAHMSQVEPSLHSRQLSTQVSHVVEELWK